MINDQGGQPMKKFILILFSVCIAQGAYTQNEVTLPSLRINHWGHRYNDWRFYAAQTQIGPNSFLYTAASDRPLVKDEPGFLADIMIPTGEELWYNPANSITNRTKGGGTTAIMRGSKDYEATFYIDHVLKGRIYAAGRDDRGTATGTQHTTVIGLDKPEESKITGVAAGTRTRNAGFADNAITITWARDTPMGNWTFEEGNYFGGDGFAGGHFENIGTLEIKGSSFVAGKFTDTYNAGLYVDNNTPDPNAKGHAASGLIVSRQRGTLTISNRTGVANDRFQAATYNSENIEVDAGFNQTHYQTGGDGLTKNGGAEATITGGDFYGSQERNNNASSIVRATKYGTRDQSVIANGGHGVNLNTSLTMTGGRHFGGDAMEAHINGPNGHAETVGGSGLVAIQGSINITGGEFKAGKSRTAKIAAGKWKEITPTTEIERTSDENGTAIAMGGAGIRIKDSSSVVLGGAIKSYGGRGATANASALAEASGGAGLLLEDSTTTVNGGMYYGGNGGQATSAGRVSAYGGAGAYATGGSLTIHGGEFTGGTGGSANGARMQGNVGIWATEANLTINDSVTNTVVHGDLVFENSAAKNLSISGGSSIEGDIYKQGSGTTSMTISENASYSGAFIQREGNVAITLSSSDQSKFFSDVQIMDGDMTFSGSKVITADNSTFSIGGVSNTLNFGAAGVELGKGSSISAGDNNVTTAGDFSIGENASVGFSFNSLSGVRGSLAVTGVLYATNKNSRIIASGISDTPTGTFQVATAASVELGANDVSDVVDVDFGWLTQIDTNQTDLTSGIKMGYVYNSLTNTSLSDLGNILTNVDDVILGLTNTEFYALNGAGEKNGDKQFRFTLSQLPDVSESSFQISQQLNEQIAARGTEFRSMNDFASSKPKFGKAAPTGAAGPQNNPDTEKTLQGWVRAYGGKGSKDATDKFSDYDTTSWGSVIGIDKSFGNLLIGLAGGYARTDLDGGATYQADVDTYHGSIYSTFGGESFFVDLALTYGSSSTDENNEISAGSFDSSLYSFYLGAGYAFEVGEKLAITPEVSFLASYYEQDEYDRSGILGIGTVEEYETQSYLGSIGLNFATQHQLDWLNRGIAFIPEVRAHYIREFNADPDDFTYIIGGTPTPFAVRSRDENLLRLGFGFDMWSWKYQSTKFEIDYDGLFSDTYGEHVVSGKITVKF